MKGYGPPDALVSPRFAGIATFLRLPVAADLAGVDVAIVGLPFDTGATFRVGARFGPRAVREGSLALRPAYNPSQRVQVFDHVSVVDAGDAPVVPGATQPSLVAMQAALAALHGAGVTPLGLGGDHTVLLAELRAAAAARGPLALVSFDAHADTWDSYFGERYTHGTPVRRAIEEGLIDPQRSTLMGMRGGLYGPHDYDEARALGLTLVPWDELAQLGTGVVARAVEVAAGPAFLTFDIDFVDPAFAPGTGTPECGGPTSAQALALLRACRGLDIVGADVVEVLPDLDPSHITATLAATVAYEILTLIACARAGAAGSRAGAAS
ncbi:MAG: agmatinase [Thermoleophilia bacterium]